MANAAEGVEVWRGGVTPRDCDETGRLDARSHLAKAMEGLAGLAAELGMEDAFSPSAVSTLAVREHHVRFLKEAPVGEPLCMSAGVRAIGEDEAVLVQVLRHGRTGEPCAAFLTRAAHISVRERRPFAWSARTRAAAEKLKLDPPAVARPRGLPNGPVEIAASRARADELGLVVIGRGVVQPSECDVFGRLRPDAAAGRCSEAAAHLFEPSAASGGGRNGRMLVEARILYPRAPAAGARLELRSGLAEVGERMERAVHWLLDPSDGEPHAAAMVLSAGVDPQTRKLAPLPPAERAALEARAIPGLGF